MKILRKICSAVLCAAVAVFMVCSLAEGKEKAGALSAENFVPADTVAAKEVEELPLGGTPRKYHVHHRGTNASIRNWRRTRYEQGYDATQPESQVDPETGEFQESQKPEDKPEA